MRMPKLDVQDQGWAAQELPIPVGLIIPRGRSVSSDVVWSELTDRD